MAKEWPPQGVGSFAVALCVVACDGRDDPGPTFLARYRASGIASMAGFGALDYSVGRWRTKSGTGTFSARYFLEGYCGTEIEIADYPITGSSCYMDSSWVVTGSCPSFNTAGLTENYTESRSPTEFALTGTGECLPYTTPYGQGIRVSGTQSISLSDPWTEDDAIAESELDIPTDWFPGLGVVDDWPIWDGVAPFFMYQQCDFRIIQTGLEPLLPYDVSVDVYRVGEAEPYATLEDTVMSDALGRIDWAGPFPHGRGYGYRIDSSTFSAVPTP